MELVQAILESEKQSVKEFLSKFNLEYRPVSYTVYAVENDKILGTVSLSGNLIMLLAVDKSAQGENLALKLCDHVISKLREQGIFGYKVFTKPEYLPLFISMGFNLLVEGSDFIALEGGECNVKKTVNDLKTKVIMEFGTIDQDTAGIVINGNPFTNGHLALCEYALKKHSRLILFVLKEDLSEFSFKERFSLAFLATRAFGERVSVLPSTDYIVSRSTFPDYFIKDCDKLTRAFAEYDAKVFEKYFISELGIVKRYFGEETTEYMQVYNQTVKNVLKEKVEIVERFCLNDKVISAKEVRKLLKNGKTNEALVLVPQSTRAVLNLINSTKKW